MNSSTERAVEIRYDRDGWSSAWLAKRAALSPDALALVFEAERYSYSILDRRAAAAVLALASVAPAPGDVVAVLLPNGLPIVELVHASFASNVTLLLLNTRLAGAELAFQLRDTGARCLLHGGGELAHKAALATADQPQIARVEVKHELGLGMLSREQLELGAKGVSTLQSAPLDFDRPQFILYSSGTTGRPKGVALSAAQLLSAANGSAAVLTHEPEDVWLLVLPIFHVGGLSILLRSVLAGSSVLLHERFEPTQVNRDLDRSGVTGISLVASMLTRVLADRGGRPAPDVLSCVLLGGGPAPAPLLESAAELKFPIAASYGMTEAASQIATCAPGRSPSAGLCLLPGIQLRIVVDSDIATEARVGVTGEIWIKGPSVFRGYWNHPEADKSAFRDGWFRTGDLGALDSKGELQVFDRRRDLIISGGENVYPAEIETVLLGHPAVEEAGVRGIEDDEFGARAVAWVVFRRAENASEEALRAYCRERLAGYKVPVRVYAVESLPRTASGKLLRRALGGTG